MSTDTMRAALEQLSFVSVNEGETAAEAFRRVRDVARAALAQTVSAEPMAWMLGGRLYLDERDAVWDWRNDPQFDNTGYVPVPLYTAAPPAPPPRVPLSDKEVFMAVYGVDNFDSSLLRVARAIERAHGIINNGQGN